jgi:pyridoxal 5'-phosphate synthase pdxT subunit
MAVKIGVLALQGDFEAHRRMLDRLDIGTIDVRKSEQLQEIDGLIIPGGESTTLIKLLHAFGMVDPIKEFYKQGKGIFGTCAGSILVAKEIENSTQFRFGFIDITVERNGYGRQVDSFEDDILIKELGSETVHAMFIRAPRITRCGSNVTTLAEKNGAVLMANEKSVLVTTFHPELTEDTRIHRYFIDACVKPKV